MIKNIGLLIPYDEDRIKEIVESKEYQDSNTCVSNMYPEFNIEKKGVDENGM